MSKILAFVVTSLLALPVWADPLMLTCEQAANTLEVLEGVELDVACPAACGQSAVWGTEVYSDDSSICTAAVHAGRLAAGEGGAVRIRIEGGRSSYAASTQNGVTSARWDDWPRSFRFVGGARAIDCAMSAQSVEAEVGQSLTLICPAGCRDVGTVWGTDIYSDDSAICRAAIHGGAIPASGGTFLLTIHDGQSAYAASSRNGVTTSEWGAWQRSFRVSR